MAVMVVVCAVEQGGHEASSVTERGARSQARLRGDLRGGGGRTRGVERGDAEFTKAISHRESQRGRDERPKTTGTSKVEVCEAVGAALRAAWIERRHTHEWPMRELPLVRVPPLDPSAGPQGRTHRRTSDSALL